MTDFDDFFRHAAKKVSQLKVDLEDVTQLSTQFIQYFGTNPSKTKLSYLLETFSTFCSQVKSTDEGKVFSRPETYPILEIKRARNMERKKNRDVKFIENSDMKKLDKLMGSLETDKSKPSALETR